MAMEHGGVTLEQFLALPEEKPALEFEDGEISQLPWSTTTRSWLRYQLCNRLNDASRVGKLGLAFGGLRVTFGGASRVPDVSYFSWDRLPVDEHGDWIDDVMVAPDIAIEILSPGQSVTRMVRRCLRLLADGAKMTILVDPDDRSIFRFVGDGAVVSWHDDDAIDLSPILPEFRLTVNQLFAMLKLK